MEIICPASQSESGDQRIEHVGALGALKPRHGLIDRSQATHKLSTLSLERFFQSPLDRFDQLGALAIREIALPTLILDEAGDNPFDQITHGSPFNALAI
jgi:hypothetical protein